MAVISTEGKKYSDVFAQTLWGDLAYNFDEVVVNDAAATLAIGTLLGVVTATGKYKVCVETAVDGSKVPAAIVAEAETIPATTDTKVLVAFRGPLSVKKAGLVLGATYDNDAKKNAAYAALEANGIQVLASV